MTEALVTPKLITWAYTRMNLTSDDVSRKIGVSRDALTSWENNEARPSLHQAWKLAQATYIPLGYLFLSSPPVERLPLPDFRKVAGATKRPSPDFMDVLNDALRKQDWYQDHQKAIDAEIVPFVGKFSMNDGVDIIADDIRTTIGVDSEMRRKAKNWEGFLVEFVRLAEAKGIIVLRQGVVGNNNLRKLQVQEFRGFAISDKLAPLVFINDQDAKVAKIFTLAHELAHLWIGQSGVSNIDYTKRSSQQSNAIDRFCNQVAAETLTPAAEFKSCWELNLTIEDSVNCLVRKFRVSRFVVLRRAYDLDLISPNIYQQFYQIFWEDKQRPKQGQEGNFDNQMLSRNSSTFTFALLTSALEGKTSHIEAARLLNIKIKSLFGIENRLFHMEHENG